MKCTPALELISLARPGQCENVSRLGNAVCTEFRFVCPPVRPPACPPARLPACLPASSHFSCVDHTLIGGAKERAPMPPFPNGNSVRSSGSTVSRRRGSHNEALTGLQPALAARAHPGKETGQVRVKWCVHIRTQSGRPKARSVSHLVWHFEGDRQAVEVMRDVVAAYS